MTQSDTLLIYVMYLSSLTYFLGVLFYALPIPVEGVKRWAPTLIKDSIYSLVWLSIYNDVINLANYILHKILNLSWTGYFASLTGDIVIIAIVYAVMSVLSSGAGSAITSKLAGKMTAATTVGGKLGFGALTIVSGVVSSIATPFKDVAEIALFVYLSIYVIAEIIYYATPWLIALGILLMSLPFRLGRSVGGTLIATALTFYVGLPLMPTFASVFTGVIFGGVYSTSNITVFVENLVSSIFSFGLSAGFLYFVLYFIVSRVLYAFILIGIASKLSQVIAESAGGIPIRLERIF